MKKAMLEGETALQKAGLTARMLLQLHDELLFEVPEGELSATSKVVRRVMEEVATLRAPLVVDLRTGSNWGEMRPF
jgi:DNA polymerase-1